MEERSAIGRASAESMLKKESTKSYEKRKGNKHPSSTATVPESLGGED